MNHNIVETADMAFRHYESFQMQMSGAFLRALEEPAPSSPAAILHLGVALNEAQIQLLTNSAARIEFASDTVMNDAITAFYPGMGAPERKLVDLSVEETRRALIAQIARAASKDAGVVARELQNFGIAVDQAMSKRGASYTGAIVTARMGMNTNFQMYQIDRGGRKWASTLYVKTAIRGFLVSTRAEVSAYSLASRGVDQAFVRYPNPEHENHGLPFSITGKTAGLPLYSDLRSKLWHPNSVALVSEV